MAGTSSTTPPLQHPVVDLETGMMTRPWALWVQGLVAMANAVQYGIRADQPTAASVGVGTLYGVSDENVIERSNGTAWEPFGSV